MQVYNVLSCCALVYLKCSVISKLSIVKCDEWMHECVNAWCIYTVKPTWKHDTASALTLLISILLWGEGHSCKGWICTPKLGHGQMCQFDYSYTATQITLFLMLLIWRLSKSISFWGWHRCDYYHHFEERATYFSDKIFHYWSYYPFRWFWIGGYPRFRGLGLTWQDSWYTSHCFILASWECSLYFRIFNSAADSIMKFWAFNFPFLNTGGSRLSRIFWEHENLSDLWVIQLISTLKYTNYTKIFLAKNLG